MAQPKITLFLDIVSPFAYMAFYITKHSPVFKNCEVTYVPILLGGVMKACGNLAPIEIKNKDKWIDVERKRHAKNFKIPILDSAPKPFPQSTVTAGRALCAVSMLHPTKVSDSFGALYQAFWVEGQPIKDAGTISSALTKALGEADAKEVMEKVSSPEAKKKLSENSDWALEEGCFGLPWFLATNSKGEKEAFWGVDHLGQVVEYLGLDRKEDAGFRPML